MLDRKEKVTMAALIRKTGFSKTLFYRNIEVRTALDKAYRNKVRVIIRSRLLLIKLWKKS